MDLKLYIMAAITYVPGLYPQLWDRIRPNPAGTDSARYCYSVWLRHLVKAHESGLSVEPQVVAELGPGGSLGTGIAAMLSGAEQFFALDVVKHAIHRQNLKDLDDLVDLFRTCSPILYKTEFSTIHPRLESYEFPRHILTDHRLHEALTPTRVEAIRQALVNPQQHRGDGLRVAYYAPWDDPEVIQRHSVDLVFSQAVMEHVQDVAKTYQALHYWLKPTGYMSHEIDFSSHGTARQWNGHWTYSDLQWKVMRGKRRYWINRVPHSAHVDLMKRARFRIVSDVRDYDGSGVHRDRLARRLRSVPEDDLTTRAAFIQAVPLVATTPPGLTKQRH